MGGGRVDLLRGVFAFDAWFLRAWWGVGGRGNMMISPTFVPRSGFMEELPLACGASAVVPLPIA